MPYQIYVSSMSYMPYLPYMSHVTYLSLYSLLCSIPLVSNMTQATWGNGICRCEDVFELGEGQQPCKYSELCSPYTGINSDVIPLYRHKQ